jgi:hypothetical protein
MDKIGQHQLIIALDNLSKQEAKDVIEQISNEAREYF